MSPLGIQTTGVPPSESNGSILGGFRPQQDAVTAAIVYAVGQIGGRYRIGVFTVGDQLGREDQEVEMHTINPEGVEGKNVELRLLLGHKGESRIVKREGRRGGSE